MPILARRNEYDEDNSKDKEAEERLQEEEEEIISLIFVDLCIIVYEVIHKENPTRCKSVLKFYFIFI
jgi:DNA polymerase III alpha subunit